MATESGDTNQTVCGSCQSSNPAGNLFCGKCGARLDGQVPLAAQVRLILQDEWKDQKLLEVETAQAIVSRISEWAKLFGVFAAVPLALLLATLAIWGVTKFADVNEKLNKAQAQAKELIATSGEVNEGYKKLKDDLAASESLRRDVQQALARSEAVGEQVKSIQTDVSAINKKLGFTASSALTPGLKLQLESSVASYEGFLRNVGFPLVDQPLEIAVVDSLPGNTSSSYYPDQHKLTITKQFASESGSILVNYSPVVLRVREDNDPWKEYPAYTSFGMALSRYLPASFLGHPASGYPSDYGQDQWSDPNRAGVNPNDSAQSFFRALWSLRGRIPAPMLDRAVVKAWAETQGNYHDKNYATLFCDRMLQNLPAESREVARKELTQRGIPHS